MFISTSPIKSTLRTRAVRNKHTTKNHQEPNNALHQARSGVMAVGRAWDRIIGLMETIRQKHWHRARGKSFVKSSITAVSALPSEVPSPSGALHISTQPSGPGLLFSPISATLYTLPSLAVSDLTLPPTPAPSTPAPECLCDPVLDGKVKIVKPSEDGEESAIGGGRRLIGLSYPSTRLGQGPLMVTMRLGEWTLAPSRIFSREADVNSETNQANRNDSERAKLGRSSTTVTMRLGEFDLTRQRPKVQANDVPDESASRGTVKQPRMVTMRLGEFDLARQWSRGLGNGYDGSRDQSVGRGECKRMLPPAHFRHGPPMVTMRLGEFNLAVGRTRV
ncbi:hypothetical protein EW145_g6120 [Phellinidium pouzarii]|uniref:Uncharacterized protein n=1 Tax=Phellinidium pouzarii TaxID=167371 RepID=A0A4V3XBX3_9AGAM|nr:hypothetical protein EW145_g6120 [Phellinidium pouzarii]